MCISFSRGPPAQSGDPAPRLSQKLESYRPGSSRRAKFSQKSSRPKRASRQSEHRLMAQQTSSNLPKDLDLDLQSLWFTKSPIVLSPKTTRNIGKISSASVSGWSSQGPRKTYNYTTHIRYNDTLASTKIRVTWDGSNPAVTAKAEQKHFPPPRVLSRDELEEYHER